MNSRPLLDYLIFPDDLPESVAAEPLREERSVDPLQARLKDLEARLRANQPAAPTPSQDLTLSAQIDAILKRKAPSLAAASNDHAAQPAAFRHMAPAPEFDEPAPRAARVVVDPPPSAPVSNDVPAVDADFYRFTEAVYLIGQAARRFIEQPQAVSEPQANARDMSAAPSTIEIDALSAVLRETVSAFRSVADDLAVSAGEIRHYATRAERAPEQRQEFRSEYNRPERIAERAPDHRGERRRPQPAHYRDEDEIFELRETIADLQDRLDDLVHARRRGRS
ncbi:hypothetical protein [Rhizobium sp.]